MKIFFKKANYYSLLSLLLVLVIAKPEISSAWSSASTKITNITTWMDGHVWVNFSDFINGKNSCGSNEFSLGTAGAPQQKAMLAVALTAFATGKNVSVYSGGGCNGGQEKVMWIKLNQ